jgi:ribonuclease Z
LRRLERPAQCGIRKKGAPRRTGKKMSRQSFEVLILGSSSASPTSERNPSGQLLNIAERYFLIDCGEATQIQLRRYKARFQSISHIFITHLHGDHFFGLPGLVSSMHLLGRRQPLNIYCPRELKEIIDHLNSIGDTRLSFRINWIFTNDNGLNLLFEDNKVEVFSFPLKHRIFCCGFLFREKPLPRKIDKAKLQSLDISFADIMRLKAGLDVNNRKGELILNKDATLDPFAPRAYAYCSDTIFDPTIVEYIKDVDLLYHESTFLDDNTERAARTYHTTAKQAAEIARLAGAKQLMLGHYSARYPVLDGFLAEAGEIFKDVLLATDGKKVQI